MKVSIAKKKCWLQSGAYRTEALWICKQLTTTRKVNLFLSAERNVKYSSRIIGTNHCCPRFAAGDAFGIEKILRNMAFMSNMFSHRVATKDWSLWYIKWKNMGRKGNMDFLLQCCKRT